jgi:hypothetical protein
VRMCLAAIRARDTAAPPSQASARSRASSTRDGEGPARQLNNVAALYGFSGGGYNIRHVLAALTVEERARIKLVVVLGAPNNPPSLYRGPWDLVYRTDPPAGHMAGPAALLAEFATESASTRVHNAARAGTGLHGKPLRYLIGTDAPGDGRDGEIVECGYDVTRPPGRGIAVKYCNLFDEEASGKYGPYLHTSDTAAQYHEGQIDPRGEGWRRNLAEQLARACAQGFRIVELDNPDAYAVADVVGAVELAAGHGLDVIAKNPLLIDGDPVPYLAHPAVTGVIVERGAGNPADMHALRCRAGKPALPVWFVSFGAGRAWAGDVARIARPFREMRVTHSSRGEYASSEDVT